MDIAKHGCWQADTVRCSVALLAAALLLSACAVSPEAQQKAEQAEAEIETILTQPLDDQEYGKPQRCLSTVRYNDFEVLDDTRVLFKGTGDRMWLNELPIRCPGMRYGSALLIETHTMQVCELDRFEVTDWFMWPRYQRTPWEWWRGVPCTLGKFQQVTPEQVAAIKAALAQARK